MSEASLTVLSPQVWWITWGRRRKAGEEMVVRERRVLILSADVKCLFFVLQLGEMKENCRFLLKYGSAAHMFPLSLVRWDPVCPLLKQSAGCVLTGSVKSLEFVAAWNCYTSGLTDHPRAKNAVAPMFLERNERLLPEQQVMLLLQQPAVGWPRLCQYAAPELCFFSLKQWWLLSWQLFCWLICSGSLRSTSHQLWILTASTKTAFESRCGGQLQKKSFFIKRLSCLRDRDDGIGGPPGTLHKASLVIYCCYNNHCLTPATVWSFLKLLLIHCLICCWTDGLNPDETGNYLFV